MWAGHTTHCPDAAEKALELCISALAHHVKGTDFIAAVHLSDASQRAQAHITAECMRCATASTIVTIMGSKRAEQCVLPQFWPVWLVEAALVEEQSTLGIHQLLKTALDTAPHRDLEGVLGGGVHLHSRCCSQS